MKHMYCDLADYWHLLSPPQDYVEEAEIFRRELSILVPNARTLLELGSGGGNNALHLSPHYELTLTDLCKDMVRQSKLLLPDVVHHVGDMRTLRLGQQFDIVFVHDAITYMTTRNELLAAMTTAFAHCNPGGVALFVPDETKERFTPTTECGGADKDGIGFRYLEWVWDADASDEICTTDYTFVVRGRDDTISVTHERHTHGLFAEQVWLDLMKRAGFVPQTKICAHSEVEKGLQLFIGRRV